MPVITQHNAPGSKISRLYWLILFLVAIISALHFRMLILHPMIDQGIELKQQVRATSLKRFNENKIKFKIEDRVIERVITNDIDGYELTFEDIRSEYEFASNTLFVSLPVSETAISSTLNRAYSIKTFHNTTGTDFWLYEWVENENIYDSYTFYQEWVSGVSTFIGYKTFIDWKPRSLVFRQNEKIIFIESEVINPIKIFNNLTIFDN